MAKIIGPLQSASASGKIGARLTFSKRKSGQQARFQKSQKDFISADRTVQREAYKLAVHGWNTLDTEAKLSWNELAYSLQMTGYNLYIKLCLSENIGNLYGQRLFGLFTYGINN